MKENFSYIDSYIQGVHLILFFFLKILKYIPNSGLSRFPLGISVCVAGQTTALQQNWQSSEKSQHFEEKHNIYTTNIKATYLPLPTH